MAISGGGGGDETLADSLWQAMERMEQSASQFGHLARSITSGCVQWALNKQANVH